MKEQKPELIIVYEPEISFEDDFVDFISEVLDFEEREKQGK